VNKQARSRLATATSLAVGLLLGASSGPASGWPHLSVVAQDPAVTIVYPVRNPRGLMVTTGGWAYCEQVRSIARTTRYTLLCGRYHKDGYLGPGLRSQRRLDWGDPAYLADLALKARRLHNRLGGDLLLMGVSYSGFGIAALASHHPELRPDKLIVVDSYLDLVARRSRLPDWHPTANEIDAETGGTAAALRLRSVSVDGLARLVRGGTKLITVWSISEDERRYFEGATCNSDANAATLSRLARTLGRPVPAWVTMARHGHTLWHHGAAIVAGRVPGRLFQFRSDGVIPPGAVCRS
jgi:hypothetical protein